MTYGLIGFPLSHSFSQGYFTEKFDELGLADTHRYLNFAIEDFRGFDELRQLHPRLDPAAENIGAVNCIRVEKDGTLTGFNTDYLGFQTDLLTFLREYNWTQQAFGLPHHDDLLETFLEETKALVLGTGGASLAVHEALRALGVTTMAVSRTAGEDRITYADLSPALLQDYHLIINTTPLGMSPKIDACPNLPYEALGPAHFCYDLVYNPNPTLFLQKAAARRGGRFGGRNEFHLILKTSKTAPRS